MKLPARVRGFHELVDILVPDGRGALVVLQAYFDASTRQRREIFCVAGYAFRKLQLQKFDRDWWKLFGKYGGCHMKELVHGIGRFEGADRDGLIKQAVQILRKRAAFGVAVSCNLAEMDAFLPKWIRGFEHAYPVCCQAMMLLGSKVGESGRDDYVAYTFETGDPYSGSAHQFMNNATKSPELRNAYRHKSHTFGDKKDALALQGADVLAWEWAKYVDETMTDRIRPMRLSLANLISRNSAYDAKVYKVTHLQGAPLRRFTEQVAQLGLLQRAEDAARKNSSSDQSA